MKFYTEAECRRKAEQHWEMAGLASADQDYSDSSRHTALAREWDALAAEGGGDWYVY